MSSFPERVRTTRESEKKRVVLYLPGKQVYLGSFNAFFDVVLFSRPRYDVVHIVPRIGERSQDVIKYDKYQLFITTRHTKVK